MSRSRDEFASLTKLEHLSRTKAAGLDNPCTADAYLRRAEIFVCSRLVLVMTPTPPDEQDLVALCRAGDESAFRTLYLRYAPKLLELATWLTNDQVRGEDLVQDIFADLWMRRSTLIIHGPLRAYLYQAVRNRAANIRRNARVIAHLDIVVQDGNVPGLGEPAQSPDAMLVNTDIESAINKVVRSLPPARREAVVLYLRQGLSYEEIASIMGITVASAKMHITRMRILLRPILEGVLGVGVLVFGMAGWMLHRG